MPAEVEAISFDFIAHHIRVIEITQKASGDAMKKIDGADFDMWSSARDEGGDAMRANIGKSLYARKQQSRPPRPLMASHFVIAVAGL